MSESKGSGLRGNGARTLNLRVWPGESALALPCARPHASG